MTMPIACRRFIIQASSPDWPATRFGIRVFIGSLIVLPILGFVLVWAGHDMMIPVLAWCNTLPVVVPGLIRLRKQNRRRVRKGERPVARGLPALYATGWVVLISVALSEIVYL
jgi:hypothetical protein